jgi:glycosyltransferase XagB
MLSDQVLLRDSPTDALDLSINDLRRRSPELSASVVITKRQLFVLALVIGLVTICAVRSPWDTAAAVVTAIIILYLVTLGDRMFMFVGALKQRPALKISDDEARNIPDKDLPQYTILLPMRSEPDPEILRSVRALEYPADKLDIRILLESNDIETIAGVLRSGAEDFAQLVIVPDAMPRTKPKACNYGLHGAVGEIVTIYDAEDIPDPLQLRRAAAAFQQNPDVHCIQAILRFDQRGSRNILTRWFTSEYDIWHGFMMPGLMTGKAPIPLGGTSNHIHRRTLDEIGGWDAFNVTEDADLGIRLARLGYSTAVLDSTTYEEPNSDPINWIRQRSRWYKGFLQTFLVHTRHPILLWRQLRTRGVLRFLNVTVGSPLLPVANAVLGFMFVAWIFGQPEFIRHLLPPFTYYLGLLSFVLGNAVVIYVGLIAARVERKPHLAIAALLTPLYWVLMSIAAVKALVQLVVQPSLWEKTSHVLDRIFDVG